jgi:transcriptional regulator with GAF, ATPase, and Fis domain
MPIITVNCGALPETLFESVFGRARIYWSQPVAPRIARKPLMDQPVLDEIGDMPS